MDRIDEMIGRALSEEDRALLARHGEPGYIAQAFGLFRGPLAWALWLAWLFGTLAFVAALVALWQAITATDALAAIKWGIGALFLSQFAIVAKGFMGAHMEANRTLREIKRVELQLALLRGEQG